MILDRLFGITAATSRPSAWDDFWYMNQGVETTSGIPMSPDHAMRVAAVMSCVRVLAETIASLPFSIMERLANGGAEKAVNHPLYFLLHNQPNSWQTSFEFWEMMVAHLGLRGRAYAKKVPGVRGPVDQLIPLHPDLVKVEQLETGRLAYTVSASDGHQEQYPQDQIFHMRDLSSDGINGLSRIELHADTIGMGAALERFRAAQLKNGAVPRGVVERPAEAGNLTETAAANFTGSWETRHGGVDNSGRMAVLEDGMKYHELGLSNEDAQLLEFMRADVLQICRIYRVPPHKVGELERATFSNIEHQEISFVQDSIVPWLVRIEKAISRDLILNTTRFFPKFNVDGLLRGDAKSRNEARSIALRSGALNRNEWRAYDDLNPVPDGNEYFMSADLVPVSRVMEPPEPPPAPAPPDGTDDDQAKDVQPGSDARYVLQVLAMDIGERIASSEAREAEKRIAKAAEDPDRFAQWVLGPFLRKQQAYAEKALWPLLAATKTDIPAMVMAHRLSKEAADELVASEDLKLTCLEWRLTRANVIASILTEEYLPCQ